MKMEWPAATPATNRARDREEKESGCLKVLKERMRGDANVPVSKEELRQDFPEVSARAFASLFSHASRETGCVAWSKAGRRRRKTT
jgi:hypothetical protein